MHEQLSALRAEFDAARRHLHELTAAVPDDTWTHRPAPEHWSVGECVAHLNITAAEYEPLVERAVADARRIGGTAPHRYRRDPIGWLLWRTMGPPVRSKMKTTAAFVPSGSAPKPEALAEFDRWQDAQVRWVEACDGLPIDKVKLTSPFSARVRYNLFACLTILPRHQERHIWQGWQAARLIGTASR